MKIFKEKLCRNNHNAPKLIEKYNNLAREALSSGDKILSEIIFNMQIILKNLNEQEIYRKARYSTTNEKSNELNNNNKVDGDIEKEELKNKTVNDKEEAEAEIAVSK